ncbi:MAG: TAXI family TRAP transporter solute-binding subunit [Brachymonas sp.]
MIIPQLTRRQQLIAGGVFMALLTAVLWGITRYLSPSPPRSVIMTTGAADGAYHAFGEKYKTYLKANGIELVLQPSAGSVQNLQRLQQNQAQLGLVQGGLGFLSLDPEQDAEKTPLRSLGVVGYEPLWIFVPQAQSATYAQGLQGLKAKRVAVGAEGSGTRKVALDVLGAYELSATNTTLDARSGSAGAQALIDKQIDALILVAAPQSAVVQQLLERADISLVSLAQAEGLARRLPYLSLISLKAGSVSPARNVPSRDIALLTTSANLVENGSVHPAIAYLMLEASRQVHQSATLLSRPGEFPHVRGTDFPVADEAQRYYKDGRPFLQRYLPFWAANALQRLLLILIPLAAVGIPVLKLIPAALEFKERSRLYARYGQLLKLETRLRQSPMSPEEIKAARTQLDEIERSVSRTKFGLEFTDRVYTLRQHVEFVRAQLSTSAQRS